MSDEDADKKSKEEIVEKSFDQDTENLIRDALKNFVTQKFNNRKTEDEIEAMVSTCSEFMKCFVIMGYDFKGNAIKPVFYAKNEIDADALNQYIQKFIELHSELIYVLFISLFNVLAVRPRIDGSLIVKTVFDHCSQNKSGFLKVLFTVKG